MEQERVCNGKIVARILDNACPDGNGVYVDNVLSKRAISDICYGIGCGIGGLSGQAILRAEIGERQWQ
jgi:hypothetical protein